MGESTHMNLELEKLKAVKVLGRGATGTVFLVTDTDGSSCPCPFALKVVEKSPIHGKLGAARRARWEMSVLARLSQHPSLPTLLGTLETDDLLAWAVPYCPGGDLNVLRYRQTERIFSPSAVLFYVAEIVCALECLHRMGIVYRDLKPENVLIQQSGHVMLTDFDLSRSLSTNKKTYDSSTSAADSAPTRSVDVEGNGKSNHRRRRDLKRLLSFVPEKAKSARVSPATRRILSFSAGERSHSFVGTEEYVAPEVVRGDGHEFAVDWWALGILTYEMAYGKTPFRGRNRKETFRNVMTKSPEFVGRPSVLTDLISRLLEKDPSYRLGFRRGATEIKEHAFFRGLRWDMLTEVSRPPFLALSEDETALTEMITGNDGLDIREYLQKLRQKPSQRSPSPSTSLSSKASECTRDDSITEF